MPSWTDLERRFLDLDGPLDMARLDHQSGTEGEYWRIAAAFNQVAQSRFESLSTIAGRKLRETLGESLPDEVKGAPNDQFLWYRSLARNMRFYSHGSVGYPLNDKGEQVGWIATGSIKNPAAVSAAHCLELAAMTDEESPSSGPLTINVSGQNARLNVGSVDNSSNLISSAHTQVFAEARKTVESQVPEGSREVLLARLDALEEAVNTPSYTARYREFVQLAADHVTALAPAIAALAGLLG